MRKKLMRDILELAGVAAQKFGQSQAIRADMGHAQAIHPQPKLSEQAIQFVDACLEKAEKYLGQQRVDENGRPPELHDGNPDSSSNLEEQLPETDEGFGLCCPTDEIDEAWLSKCSDPDWLSKCSDPEDP